MPAPHHDEDPGPSYAGTVVLELGDRTGALVVHTGAERAGHEIDVCAVRDGRRTHSAVRERKLPGGSVYCAVYPGLAAGEYGIEDAPGRTVTITGGAVTEIRL